MGRTGILAFLVCALAMGTTAWADPFNDAADGRWSAPTAQGVDTWGAGLDVYPQTGDTATISTYQVDLDIHLQGADAPDLLTLAGGTLAAPGENWKRNIDSPISVTAASGLHIAGVSWNNSSFRFNGALTGAGALTVTGHPTYPLEGGRLYLYGDGTGYSGNWDIQANRVYAQTDGALGTGTVTINGGEVRLQGSVNQTPANAPALVVVNSGGFVIYDGNRVVDGWDFEMNGGKFGLRSGANISGGNISANGDFEIESIEGGPATIDSDISGTGKVTLAKGYQGTGEIILGGDNSGHSGGMDVPVGTTASPAHANALGTGAVYVQGTLSLARLPGPMTGNPTLDGGRIWTSATGTIDATATVTLVGPSAIYVNKDRTLTVDGKLTGTGGLVATGGGWVDWGSNGWYTIELTNAANDYAGDTIVQFEHAETGSWFRGNVKVTADGALSTTNVEVLNSRLTTEPTNPADAVFTSVNAVNVRGGTLVLTSTEDDGKIHLYEGGALDVAGGSTTMTYGPAGNVHIHTGAILPEDWNSGLGHPMPLASEIESGGKIYIGLRGAGGSTPTISGSYATSDVFKGVATLDNWPTIDGTITDASGDGINLHAQDARHITLNDASLQTAGPINLEGGGDYSLFRGYGDFYAGNTNWTGFRVQGTNNFAGMTGDKVVNMNARAVLQLANGGAIPADTTVEMNNGLLACADAGAVAGTVNLNEGSTLYLEKDLTSGTINAKSGSAVWVNADSRFASVTTWDGGAKGVNVVLAADNLASAPADGSVNYLRTSRDYKYGGAMVLGENNRITVAADFSYHWSGSYHFVGINATSVDVALGADYGRIAMLTNDNDTCLVIGSPLNFAGKTLIIGDQDDFVSNLWTGSGSINVLGQAYWETLPQAVSIDQQGIVMVSGEDLAPGFHQIGAIDVQGGTFWVPGYYYPDPDKLGGAETINVAQGAKMLFTTYHGHDWTVNAMFTGDGTVSYHRMQQMNVNSLLEVRELVLASDFDTEGGLAPGNSVGTLTVDADLRFAPTDIDRYAKVKIDVDDHSGANDLAVVTGVVTDLINADLVATLAVPSVACKPASIDAMFIDAAPGGIAGGDAFHGVSSGLLDASTGLDQTTREAIRDHWDLSADDVVYDTGNGDVSLVLDAADWTAIPGDADLDGSVQLSDLSTLAFNWENDTGMTWLTADFDLNGVVNLADLSVLAFHWEETEAAGAPPVPEPMTVGLLLVGGVALLRRRRR